MTCLKCVLACAAAVFVIFGILPILVMFVIFFIFAAKHGFAGIGIDRPQWHFASPAFWVSVLVVFGVGFYWELRRLRK
jgi:hypothetical protein